MPRMHPNVGQGQRQAQRDENQDMIENLTPQEALALQGLNAALDLAHETASNAGWYKDPKTGETIKRNFGEVIALMGSELSEALEADRKKLPDDKLPHRPGQEVEFGDEFIRVGDTVRAEGLDVGPAVIEVARLLQRFSMQEVRFALLLFKTLAASREFGLDLAGAIIEKNIFNRTRADHKLENRRAEGGKAY
jgi:hypothetical protein